MFIKEAWAASALPEPRHEESAKNMTQKQATLLALVLFACWVFCANASNTKIANVNLVRISESFIDYNAIEFDLAWDHSWLDEFNHDAAWVFIKYSADSGATWHHATLSAEGVNPPGFLTGSNPDIEIIVPADRKGAFVKRTNPGTGAFTTTKMRFIWDVAADKIPHTAIGLVTVHALEMVYIPQGPFYVGDNSSPSHYPVTYINTSNISKLTPESGAGTIAAPYMNLTDGMGRPQGVTGVFDPGYPNGYSAFYIMKYELSRANYLTFLNTITGLQAYQVMIGQTSFNGANGAISGSHPNYYNAQPWRAMHYNTGDNVSYSGWAPFAAWADWACLRPMTELEYEKACRGPLPPVDRDYPWGTSHRCLVTSAINANTPAESPNIREANLLVGLGYHSYVNGPMRCGAMSDEETDQFQAGASYWGVMELAGNAGEQCVSTLHDIARLYSGLHGDGELTPQGFADVTNWPAGRPFVTGGGEVGVRSTYSTVSENGTISARGQAGTTWYVTRGVRAVRTAP